MIWTLCALPVIFGSKLNAWWTALLVALLFSIPQNLGHVMENSLIPGASVRLSHFIETASSTFIFGLIIVWLLHRKHECIRDFFGIKYVSEKNNIK
jgi:ABC-type sugar transport system permease subunit